MIECIDRSAVRSNVSVKLTQIGLAVDKAACIENLVKILEHAREKGIFVRLDMEDSPWVDTTLDVYRILRFERGFENVGLVIQAYLYRSEKDIRMLSQDGTRVRLCKGAYKEPSDVAFPKKKDVDDNYDRLARMLIDCSLAKGALPATPDGKSPPISGIATHDERRILAAEDYAQKVGLPREAMEFQMLYGIRRDLQERLARQGYPVRVYVPFGTEWYPYFMRRLAERPANLWFFISNFLRG